MIFLFEKLKIFKHPPGVWNQYWALRLLYLIPMRVWAYRIFLKTRRLPSDYGSHLEPQMTYCKVFTSPLLLLRPSLVASATPLLPPEAIVTSRFMVFVVHYLNNCNFFTFIVLDGYKVNWADPRATQPNLLRGLLNISSIISPATNFILFFDEPLDDFQFNSPNLIVVPRKLTQENLKQEVEMILLGRSS